MLIRCIACHQRFEAPVFGTSRVCGVCLNTNPAGSRMLEHHDRSQSTGRFLAIAVVVLMLIIAGVGAVRSGHDQTATTTTSGYR